MQLVLTITLRATSCVVVLYTPADLAEARGYASEYPAPMFSTRLSRIPDEQFLDSRRVRQLEEAGSLAMGSGSVKQAAEYLATAVEIAHKYPTVAL